MYQEIGQNSRFCFMTIQFRSIPALREIRTVSKLDFGRVKQLIKEAAPHFVKAGCSPEDGLYILEQTLMEREQPVELHQDQRTRASDLLHDAMEEAKRPEAGGAAKAESVFAANAPGLIALGYSVLARNPKENHPAINGWSDWCEQQPGSQELAAWSRVKGADISLACGYGGSLPSTWMMTGRKSWTPCGRRFPIAQWPGAAPRVSFCSSGTPMGRNSP
jgi:hypothetical protein